MVPNVPLSSPNISIIIPVGPGRDARTALGSLAAAGAGDEVIVVGDGHLPDLYTHFGKGLPLRVLQTPIKGGANAARNLGAATAENHWLAFLDDDDAYLSDALARMRKAVALSSTGSLSPPVAPSPVALPPPVAFSLGWRIASGRRQWFARRPAVLSERHLRRRNVAGGCSSLLVRKEALDRIGGFDATMPAMQDWDVWLRLARMGPIHTLAEPCVLYHDHAGPRISTNLDARIAGFERLLQKYGSDWSARVVAFHRSRLAAWRWRNGLGPLLGILEPRAPLASVLFALQAIAAKLYSSRS